MWNPSQGKLVPMSADPPLPSESSTNLMLFRHLSKRDVDPDLHNTIIYKDSDVVYHFKHSTCSSTQSPKLRLIQVFFKIC